MKNLFAILLFFVSTFAFSQEEKKVNLSLTLLGNDRIADVNINQESFIASLTVYTDYFKTKFKDLPASQKMSILLVAHTKGNATYSCYTNPKNEALENSVAKDLSAFTLENTKLLDFPILFSVNCTSEAETQNFEGFKNPFEEKMEYYAAADLKTKVQLNKEYVINEVLPVLAAYEMKADAQFKGVNNMGKLIQNTDFNQPQDVIKLTDKNNDYWQATVEMEAGNQLIPLTKIAMLVSQGEFDYAMRYLEIMNMFSNPKTTASYYMKELSLRLEIFYEDLNQKMATGLENHDKGNLEEAMDIYQNILAAHPNSSWAMYEYYFSNNALKLKNKEISAEDYSYWYEVRPVIYSHNPVYDVDVHATTGKQAYLIMRRQQLKELFAKKEERLKDVFKYAEIATDLDAPGLAAQFFWLTATFDKDATEESINNFLYCLNKLGCSEIKSNFKGDYDKVFKKIDAQKEKEMKSNFMYKALDK